MMEPWDGPASILFTDGDLMGAVLDRNGLRPSRYYILSDDRLILSSEVGVLDLPEGQILRKDRLRPGKMLLVDLKRGAVLSDSEIKARYARREPLRRVAGQQPCGAARPEDSEPQGAAVHARAARPPAEGLRLHL